MNVQTSGAGGSSAAGGKPLMRLNSGVRKKDDQVRIVGEHYQLGAEIGRGGFGVVFAALDLRNGRSVAIKQVSLHDIDKEELLSIESEISLLKKLNHENIVKYHDTIKTQSSLYIVLEYMENGSLAQFMKKFGSLSETLVAMYITQVLRGLAYLHEQGVLHRDVKGANILTTKDGLVKLADFGVAIKLSETQKSNSVVGSPYWMAPEVIEMAGWSFASDIWSVGCTIIELLTTKPPYFDLAPMAALFRIVQDDHPPLPERISPAMHDFIVKCFMKEPRLRSSAEELLAHPWIAQIPKNKVEQSTQLVAENVTSTHERDAMLNTIKLYTKKKRHGAEEGGEDDEDWDDEFGVKPSPKPMTLNAKSSPVVKERGNKQQLFQLTKEDENQLMDDDVWEDDGQASGAQRSREKSSFKQPSKRLNAASASWSSASLLPVEKRLSKLRSFCEDEDEVFDDLDEEKLLEVAVKKHIGSTHVEQRTPKPNGDAHLDQFRDDDEDELDEAGELTHESSFARLPHRLSNRDIHVAPDEPDDEFQETLFDDELDFEYSSVRDNNQKATWRVVEMLALLDPSMDDQVILDACNNLEEIFESNPSLRRDLTSQPGVVPNIMESLEVKKMDVLHAVLKVINMIIEDNQKFQENMALIGLIPIIIKLTRRNSDETLAFDEDEYAQNSGPDFSRLVRLEAAKFVRQSCKTSSLTIQMFIACGGLPVLVDFLTLEEGRPIEAQMDLLCIALDGVFSVFNLPTIPKNDICRLFVKAGLLKKFIIVFNEIVYSLLWEEESSGEQGGSKWTVDQLHKICDIFLLFSQGDAVVKEHMCEAIVLDGMLEALYPRASSDDPVALTSRKSPEYVAAMVKVLKCIRNLSMEPLTLERLDRAGAIPTLVQLLNEEEPTAEPSRAADMRRKELENIILQSMFYLCRINRNRQTHAAQAGITPVLQKVINSTSPLKQFALPILCDLAHASPTARAQLWACNSVTIFLDLLDDKYWQLDAIKSISVWLIHDTVKMENVLLVPANTMKLINCFRSAQDAELENLLDPLLDMMMRSVRLNQAFGRCSMFVNEILKRLRLVPKAIVRKNLLKMLKCLFESHTAPTRFLVEYNLHPIIYSLAQDENSMILVKEIASQLLQAIIVSAAIF